MGFRFLFYMTQVWDMQRRQWVKEEKPVSQWRFAPIVPVLFYTGERRWDEPISITTLMDLPASLDEFIPQHKVLRLNVKMESKAFLISTGHPVGWPLSVIQQEGRAFNDFAIALQDAIRGLEPLEGVYHAHWEQLMYFLVLLIYHRRQEPERQPLLQLVDQNIHDQKRREEVSQMGLTAAEFIQRQTEQKILIRLMETRFGSLPTRVYQAIQAIEAEEKLSALLDQILTASTLVEMESLLNGGTG